MNRSQRLLLSFVFVLAIVAGFRLFTQSTAGMSRVYADRITLTGKPVVDPLITSSLDSFVRIVESRMAAEKIPGMALAIVKDSTVLVLKGFGVRDLKTGLPVDEHTVFRLASLSKGFAPVIAGMLVDEKKIHWDDSVRRYLPAFHLNDSSATHELTLRHVLSHTTGLPRHTYSNLLNKRIPYRKILPQLAGVKLAHPVGTWYNYQNVAYCLIGDVIEKATGRSYDTLLQERIFTPLGMRDASTGYRGITAGTNVAYPHSPDAKGYHRIELADKYYDVSPAAGVNASASDMAQWLMMMMGRRPDLLSVEALQEICSQQIAVSPAENVVRSWRPVESSGYGLGWRLVNRDGMQVIYHGGFVNGYRSEIGFCPKEGIGMVLLSNGPSQFIGQSLPTFFDLYRRMVMLRS